MLLTRWLKLLPVSVLDQRKLSTRPTRLRDLTSFTQLKKAGVDVSRPTVQRALAKKGVYENLIKASEGPMLGPQPANAIRSAR